MAQTGYTPILIYSSSTAAAAPAAGSLTNSTLGSELAINITDGKLFYKDNANAVQVIGWKTVPTTAGGTGLTSYTAGDLIYYASGTTFTKLAIGANTTILTSSGTAPQWSSTSGITVGTATNIAGGAAGSVPYQSGVGTTTFVGIGSAYQALQVNAGGTAPTWQPSASSVLTAQGDILYASAANTLARLAKNTTATRYLANTGTSNNPDWAQVNLANGVTGTLPVGNGGTGLATLTANRVLYASATNTVGTSANFAFDGTDLNVGTSATTQKINSLGIETKNSVQRTVARKGTFAQTSATVNIDIAYGDFSRIFNSGIAAENVLEVIGEYTDINGNFIGIVNASILLRGNNYPASSSTAFNNVNVIRAAVVTQIVGTMAGAALTFSINTNQLRVTLTNTTTNIYNFSVCIFGPVHSN